MRAIAPPTTATVRRRRSPIVTRIRCAVRGSMLSVSRGFGRPEVREARDRLPPAERSASVCAAVAAAPAPPPLAVRGAGGRRDLFRWRGIRRRLGVARSRRGILDHRVRRLSGVGRLGHVPFDSVSASANSSSAAACFARSLGAPPLAPLSASADGIGVSTIARQSKVTSGFCASSARRERHRRTARGRPSRRAACETSRGRAAALCRAGSWSAARDRSARSRACRA